PDPDEAYRQLILPIKKICASYYLAKGTILMDFVLVALTAIALVSHSTSLALLKRYLRDADAPSELIQVVSDRLKAA
ncbi:hypothetical protein EBR57_05960, partial [bacterium]|nr:hypothetical protein [bacterium]